MNAHRFHPSILREYDIRGVVGETVSAADAEALGRAYAAMLRGETGAGGTVCVGRDGRATSPELEDALVEGLTESGADVVRIGLGPTPMLYFAVAELEAAGGIAVTGSHNPPAHNGFKLQIGRRTLFGGEIRKLGEIAAAGDFVSGAGTVSDADVRARYVDRLAEDYRGARPLTVAWDAGNGAAGEIMARLTKRLPGRHILLNEKIDGTFPAHHPDPTVPENLRQLQDTVAREGCDLGFAFDGDGDRIGVVDDAGGILWGDQLMMFLAGEVLADRPGATVIADVKASQTLFDTVSQLGGRPLMWKTGHSLIKAKMAETGAPLAGEMTGHIFFADRYYGFDDALYAAVRFLGVASRLDEPLSAARAQFPAVVNTPEIRFTVPEERKFAVISEVAGRLMEAGADVDSLDGVRVTSPDGWWLLRASNTQNALVARCESRSADGLDRLKQELTQQLAASGIEAPAL